MALTTQRLETMTLSARIRGDGAKNPLRVPPNEIQKHRKASSQTATSEDSKGSETESADELGMPKSFEEVHESWRETHHKQKQTQHAAKKTLEEELSQSIQDINYDVESHARINAHLLHTKLQANAKEASLSLSIEGFPKESTEGDRRAFAEWVLQKANSWDRDRSPHISFSITRGELSNFINISFTSGFHRQWFLQNFVMKKKKLYRWALSSGRESNNEMRIRESLSEDARSRGRFLKAGMEIKLMRRASTPMKTPSGRSTYATIWFCYILSYSTATCEVFVDECLFEVAENNFEMKLSEISKNVKKGNGHGKYTVKTEETRKGSSKGTYGVKATALSVWKPPLSVWKPPLSMWKPPLSVWKKGLKKKLKLQPSYSDEIAMSMRFVGQTKFWTNQQKGRKEKSNHWLKFFEGEN